MTQPIILLCPGQGAQAVGMGRKWAEASPAAAAVFQRADEMVAGRMPEGRSLGDICFNGPDSVLNRTDVAQPALYVAGVASARALFGDDFVPTAAAGLSLGEYTALHLAGAFSFEEGLELVMLRGRAMQDAAEATPSGMVALIGAEQEQARAVCDRAAQGEVLVSANFNAPGQIVISGSSDACDRAVASAAEMGVKATKLAVAGAFHSPIMAPAAERLKQALAKASINPPRCPVLANVSARPHDPDPDSIRLRLVEQLTRAVLWSDCCRRLAGHASGEFHELAPGRVLAGLFRRIDRTVRVTSHDEPA